MTASHPPARQVYEKALRHYQQSNYERAYELFTYAKDLDALKFRAPEIFNDIIREKAEKHGMFYVPIYECMKDQSENHINR